jgi:hypothetical protein
MGTEGQPETFSTTYVFLRLQPRGAFAARDPTDSSVTGPTSPPAPAGRPQRGVSGHRIFAARCNHWLTASGRRPAGHRIDARSGCRPVFPVVPVPSVPTHFPNSCNCVFHIYARHTHTRNSGDTQQNKTLKVGTELGTDWGQTGDIIRPASGSAMSDRLRFARGTVPSPSSEGNALRGSNRFASTAPGLFSGIRPALRRR